MVIPPMRETHQRTVHEVPAAAGRFLGLGPIGRTMWGFAKSDSHAEVRHMKDVMFGGSIKRTQRLRGDLLVELPVQQFLVLHLH